MTTPVTCWSQLDRLHRELAGLDAPDPAPHLLAYHGRELLTLVWLRPFAPAAYQGPLIEALALALPLGADRVSIALPGRAWSMDDPVPPVTDGVDLRQRVLTQVTVDGHDRDPPHLATVLHPFQVDTAAPRGLVWHPRVDPGRGEGWIPEALVGLVAIRHDIGRDATAADLDRQVRRLRHLGHGVVLTGCGKRACTP